MYVKQEVQTYVLMMLYNLTWHPINQSNSTFRSPMHAILSLQIIQVEQMSHAEISCLKKKSLNYTLQVRANTREQRQQLALIVITYH